MDIPSPSPEDLRVVAGERIFFGHQSVGRNVLAGMAQFSGEIRIVSGVPPDRVDGPALMEAAVGRNGEPATKDRDFLTDIQHMNRPGEIAMYKYCFTDISASSDPVAVFGQYRETLRMAEALHSGLRVIPMTMPITTAESGWKRLAKSLLGKTTDLELNRRRMRFNELLRREFSERPILDVARYESTYPDGSRHVRTMDGEQVEILADEYTTDGSHLNEAGRRWVAARFIAELAEIGRQRPPQTGASSRTIQN